MSKEQLFTIQEVSAKTGINQTTLRNHLRLGKFKATRKDNRILLNQNEIDRYLSLPDIINARENKIHNFLNNDNPPFSLTEFFNQYHDLSGCGATFEQQKEYFDKNKNLIAQAIDREIEHLEELKATIQNNDFFEFDLKF